jgi:hypothetical protein
VQRLGSWCRRPACTTKKKTETPAETATRGFRHAVSDGAFPLAARRSAYPVHGVALFNI